MAVLDKKAASKPPLFFLKGFTLIELIMVLVLMGTLAVVMIPRLDETTFREYGYSEEVLSALRHARQTAIARNARVTVAFAGNGFRICQSNSCPASGGNYLLNPANGQPWNGSAERQGRAPDGVSLATALAGVTFDGLGRPSTGGNLSIGSHTLSIEAETGYVY